MNANSQTHPATPALAAAISAERTAQNAYAKFFFEVEECQSDAIALLRLLHTDSTRLLETELKKLNGALPEYTESEGPFAADPRQGVFDIEYQFIFDYMKSSEQALSQCWDEIAATNETVKAALPDREEKIQQLLATLENQTASSGKRLRKRNSSDQLAQCG